MSSCAVSCASTSKGFVRIRHFGFLANRRRSTLLPLCFAAWYGSHPDRTEPLLKNRTLFGAAPSVADQWRSSNDLLLRKSNSVLHLCWSQLRHETARPQLENSARLTALRPRPPCSRPDPTSRPVFQRFPPSISFLRSRQPTPPLPCRLPPTSHLFLTPFNCIRPASAAPAASF